MKDTCYLVLQDRGKYPSSAKFSITRATKNKPNLQGHQIALKLTVTLPDDAFRTHFLEAEITVEDRHIIRPKVQAALEEAQEDEQPPGSCHDQ